MRVVIILSLALLFSCQESSTSDRTNFPNSFEIISTPPRKENFWIFILAGQSNMAGRGLVMPEDTISSFNILSIDSSNHWYLAKEPIHFYEPNLTGLDCGLSFAKEFVQTLPDSVYVGIVPCAVGGSSVEQWLGDSLHRNVRLYSNFESKVALSQKDGVIKGILWHQGESNAHPGKIALYQNQLETLFRKFRTTIGNDSLPIVVGEIPDFLKYKNGLYGDSINQVLRRMEKSDRNIDLVITSDLIHKGDTVHLNSASLRTMGKRYADKYKQRLKKLTR